MLNITEKPGRLKKDEVVLVVVDFQERITPAMRESGPVVAEACKLIKGFEALGLPVLLTQQYTRGLGDSVPEIKDAFVSFSYIEKTAFSVMGEQDFVDALMRTGRKTVVLCGIEAHVCVLQSALDLLAAGYAVFLATDAISSRKQRDEKPGVKRMIQAGVVPTTVESALFELLDNDSKSDTFKTISKLIR